MSHEKTRDSEDFTLLIARMLGGQPDYWVLEEAKKYGIVEPLAAYIEQGGELSDYGRRWLSAELRGENPKRKRGQKRTLEKREADQTLWFSIAEIMASENVSEYRALQQYVEADHGRDIDTCRSALKRAKSDSPNLSTEGLVRYFRNPPQD